MKSKIFTLFIAVMMVVLFSAPVFAYSSGYAFTMQLRAVDGSENGQYHSLGASNAHISGKAYVYDSAPGSLGPYDIYYTLHKEVIGVDPNYGTINGGINGSFSGIFPNNGGASDKYYLFIWKVEDDGNDVYGSGGVSN